MENTKPKTGLLEVCRKYTEKARLVFMICKSMARKKIGSTPKILCRRYIKMVGVRITFGLVISAYSTKLGTIVGSYTNPKDWPASVPPRHREHAQRHFWRSCWNCPLIIFSQRCRQGGRFCISWGSSEAKTYLDWRKMEILAKYYLELLTPTDI